MKKRAHIYTPSSRTEEGRVRCKRCGLERRELAVLAPGWNRVGSGVFAVASVLWLYRRAGGVAWHTWKPECAK